MRELCQRADAIMGAEHGRSIFGSEHEKRVHFASEHERPVHFGTLLDGSYSVAEAKDLLDAKDKDMSELARQSPPMLAAWRAKDAAGAAAWERDFANLKARFAKAKADVLSSIGNAHYNPLPNSMISADTVYKNLLTAINPLWTAHTNAPGSIGDLSVRLGQGSAMAMQKYDVPQPRPQSDLSMQVLQAADKKIRTAQDAGTAVTEGAADLTKDVTKGSIEAIEKLLKAPLKGAEEALHLPFWVIVLIAGAGGTLFLYLLYRGVKAAAPVALRVAEVATPQGRMVTALRSVNAGLGTSAFQGRVQELQGAH